MTDAENKLRAAIRPFAELGAVLTPMPDNYNTVWTTIPQNTVLLATAGLHGWDITAGQLRAAYLATVEEGEDVSW
jgi:hypothetical protein